MANKNKSIIIRFRRQAPAEVFTQTANGRLQPVALDAPLTKFTLGSLATAPAEMSIQVAPWTREYQAPLIWHLNQAWSLGQQGIRPEDLVGSKPPGTTSQKDIKFTYNQEAGTIDWDGGTAKGQVTFGPSSPGWYLILRQKGSDQQTAGLTVKNKAVLKI